MSCGKVCYDKLFSAIEELKDEYLRYWIDVCNIESPTAHKAGVDAVGAFFGSVATRKGWRVEVVTQEVAGNLVMITSNPDASGKAVTLSAHMDTVHSVGSFGSPAVKIDGDKIIGPGVADCKGGGIMAMLIMDALEKIGWRERPIQLLLQSDEEVGSRYSKKATINTMCERAKDSLAFLNLEPHTKGLACIERKGIVRYTVNVYGKAAHSSICAKAGANAIVEASNKIIKIDRYKEAEGITCNVGTITGGTVSNTVPDKCSFEVDVRFANSEQRSAIDKILRDIVSECTVPGCEADITVLSTRASMKREERNLALLDKFNHILSDAGMDTLSASFGNGGSDAAEVTEFGIPCIDSLGVEGVGIHQLSEFSYISSLVSGAKRIGAFIYAVED